MAIRLLVFTAGIAWLASAAAGQQAAVEAPAVGVGSGFYEQVGVRWGLRGNGWFFNFGGPPLAPPFGGFDPNAGANFGFAGPNGFFNVTAGQGSTRSLSGTAPSVTVMNGGQGFFSDTVQRPFVTGVVPVVGGASGGTSVLQERLHRLQTEGAAAGRVDPPPAPEAPPSAASSAERGDMSVAAIKARKEAARAAQQSAAQAEIDALLERARGADEAGKPGLARIYRQMAARQAEKIAPVK